MMSEKSEKWEYRYTLRPDGVESFASDAEVLRALGNAGPQDRVLRAVLTVLRVELMHATQCVAAGAGDAYGEYANRDQASGAVLGLSLLDGRLYSALNEGMKGSE